MLEGHIDDREEHGPGLRDKVYVAPALRAFLRLAFAADIAARAVIDLLLAEATQRASGQSVRAWLQNALKPGLVSDIRTSDMNVILELQHRAQELDLADPVSEEKRKKN